MRGRFIQMGYYMCMAMSMYMPCCAPPTDAQDMIA